MEKYARQSIAEGLLADKVEITTDSELYKILNLHYNRNNQIEVRAIVTHQSSILHCNTPSVLNSNVLDL